MHLLSNLHVSSVVVRPTVVLLPVVWIAARLLRGILEFVVFTRRQIVVIVSIRRTIATKIVVTSCSQVVRA